MPELVEVGAQGADPIRIDLIDPTGTGPVVDHQPGVLQRPEVLGDGRPADGKLSGQLADRSGADGEGLEDRSSRRVTERGESIGLVSRHYR